MIFQFYTACFKGILFIQIQHILRTIISHMLQRRTEDGQRTAVVILTVAVFCQVAYLKHQSQGSISKHTASAVKYIFQIFYIQAVIQFRFHIWNIHHDAGGIGQHEYIGTQRAVPFDLDDILVIFMLAGNILHRYLIKCHDDLCAVGTFCHFIFFLCRKIQHDSGVCSTVFRCVLRRSHCRYDGTVSCCDLGGQPAFCAIEIQYDLIVGYDHFFPVSDLPICLNGEHLTCGFAGRNIHFIQCYRGCCRLCCGCGRHRRSCRLFLCNIHRSGGVIPCNIQIQCCSQCAHRQHGSVIDDHRRNIHGKILPVLLPRFIVDGKYQRIVIIHHIYLLCRFIPDHFTAQFLRDLSHGQHSSAIDRYRRHILGCHGLSIDLHLDLRGIVCMVFSVIL